MNFQGVWAGILSWRWWCAEMQAAKLCKQQNQASDSAMGTVYKNN